jgi:peptidyl-prolyl cis-trans isomerase SurA
MSPMRKLIPWSLLICLTALPAFAADTVVEEIVARVNNRIVSRTEFQRSMDDLKQEVQQQEPTNADKVFADRQKDVLRDLIDQQLLLDKGTDMGISADTELIKKLDDMRKQMHLDTMEDLEKAAEAQGISFEDYKQNMRNQIITQQVIGKEVGSRLSVTKDEEQQFYDQHKADLQRPEEVRLSEILVATPKSDTATTADDSQLAAAKAKAEALLAQIRKGASFEDAAKKNSNGPTAAQGGDLGYFPRGQLDKKMEDTTFAMKAGDVSDVIQTKQGFIILKVVEHHAGGLPSMKEIEPRLQDAIYMQKLQPALREYLLKLREDAFIKIYPGYVDSGASPNETSFIETTAKDEKAKQLKKKKKIPLI